ncbi:MAG TPA: penicillin-binding protein 2 [Actinomycetes bacterium]|nr:penicillin-binding protein 2 [Actinomycetes bacterium]
MTTRRPVRPAPARRPPVQRRPPAPPRRRRRGNVRLGRPGLRLKASLVCLALLLAVYVLRLFQLQGVDAPVYAEQASAGRTQDVTLLADRGAITDVHGVVLATSVPAVDVTTDQTLVVDPAGTAAKLAPVLHMDVTTLTEILTGQHRFAYVAREVSPQTWKQVAALDLAGIYGQQTTKRVYPSGTVAANTIGFTGIDDVGLGGIELEYNKGLAGTPGKATYQEGLDGSEIPTPQDHTTEPVPGSDVRLTIDRDIQWAAQDALAAQVKRAKADSGVAVVMDPTTGHILALAVVPTFDPNNPGAASAANRGNSALSDVYEPGSTSKVMTAAAALQEGKVTPTSAIVVPPFLHRSDATFHDDVAHGTEHLTLTGVLAKSSNLGAILTAERIGPQTLYRYLKKFGIGDPTGMNFPGESSGILPPPWRWSGTQFYTIAFGQGLSVNAVQAASVYATIANNGLRVEPSLVAGTTSPDGTYHPAPAPTTTRVVSPKVAAEVRRMLESVVSEQGTAPMAEIPGYRVAGKTGTANRVDDACHCYRGYTASFIGMAPADHPRLVVAVTLQNPRNGHFGGRLAGPVFKQIMEFALATMKVPPTSTRATPYPIYSH